VIEFGCIATPTSPDCEDASGSVVIANGKAFHPWLTPT